MKTFKLVGLKIENKAEDGRFDELPLVDGLIINKEDGENSWLIEALLSKQYRPYFEHHWQSGEDLILFATITKKDNRPAQVIANVHSITQFEEHISVLFLGRLYSRSIKQEAENILSELIAQGLSGKKLLEAFKKRMKK